MDFLKNNRRFDFLYGDTPFSKLECQVMQTEGENELTTVYSFADGLKITNMATIHGDAYEWVNWFENTSDKPTDIISELYDACISLPLPREEPLGRNAYKPEFDDITTIYAPTGSTWSHDEFCSFADRVDKRGFAGHLSVGKSKTFTTSGGRSSEQNAPFFNVHKDGKGYIKTEFLEAVK